MTHLAAQRALVRMLYDPAFAAAARENPDQVLRGVEAGLRAQLAAIDPRALGMDRLRRRRTLRTLVDEFKGSTTLALAEKKSLAWLESFFFGAAFHRAVEERGALALAFAEFLAEEGPAALRAVLVIEAAIARARRKGNSSDGLAAGVVPIETTAWGMKALQACERYLFEVGLMPAVALCDDPPPLELPPADATPLYLLTVATGGGISLVTVEAATHAIVKRIAAGERAERSPLLDSLVADEIVIRK
jgi:hypothetical protein